MLAIGDKCDMGGSVNGQLPPRTVDPNQFPLGQSPPPRTIPA